MNEQRHQAYLNLIQALLDCPIGEEVGLLEANPDLLDRDLVQTMTEVALELEKRGDPTIAQYLRGIAAAAGLMAITQMAEGGNPIAMSALQQLTTEMNKDGEK